MRTMVLFVSCGILFSFFSIPMVAAQDQTKPSDAASASGEYRTLIKKNCAACHALKKVCGEVEKPGDKDWKKIVNRMSDKAKKKNIEFSEEQQKGIAEYLGALKDAKMLCAD